MKYKSPSGTCKYCGVRWNNITKTLHRHCSKAHKRGQLSKAFTDKEINKIKKVAIMLKQISN